MDRGKALLVFLQKINKSFSKSSVYTLLRLHIMKVDRFLKFLRLLNAKFLKYYYFIGMIERIDLERSRNIMDYLSDDNIRLLPHRENTLELNRKQ